VVTASPIPWRVLLAPRGLFTLRVMHTTDALWAGPRRLVNERRVRSYHANLGVGIDGLVVREQEARHPGPGEVMLGVRASSLSFRELMILRGWYPLPIKPDVIPLSDGAGEVVEVGEGVTRVAVGDRVAASIFPRWIDGGFAAEYTPQLGGSLDGMLTEYAILDEAALVHIPDHLSFEEAACLPCAAVTAWNALTGGRGLRSGETVLTLGSGGVSLFALQFAKAFGARVIATTGSDEKAERLLALGADAAINYRSTPAWSERVRELTGGRGADHVIEVAGTLEQSVMSIAFEGEIAFVGLLGRDAGLTAIDPGVIWTSALTVRAIAVGSRAQFEAMNRTIEVNRLTPVIDRVFPFDEAVAAYRYYEDVQPFGKVVIADN
jgi:NADPH:quinone reductase-like Zn-dependent oxidoreductase